MKYNEELVGKVRRGEAQIYVGQDKKWLDLLIHIFPKVHHTNDVLYNSYTGYDIVGGYIAAEGTFNHCDIIQAKDFLIQENISKLGDEDGIDLIRDKVNELVRIINNLNK